MPFRIRSILVASDLSESAAEVLRTASALAALTEAELHVVHGLEGSGKGAFVGVNVEATADRVREQLRGAVPPGAEVTSLKAVSGRPHEVILQRAEEVEADLIVIGPHRQSEEGRRTLGTTADRLVRTSDVPCLIVHAPVPLPLRRVLVPSDLSDAARGALDLALVWASALRMPSATGERTQVDVLHVLPPSSPGAAAAPGAGAGDALRREVDAAAERTGCATLLAVTPEASEGADAAEEILRHAGEHGIDLLMLGTHGESSLSRALIGSVSSAVARRAGCSVLLVPPGVWKTRQRREAEVRPEG